MSNEKQLTYSANYLTLGLSMLAMIGVVYLFWAVLFGWWDFSDTRRGPIVELIAPVAAPLMTLFLIDLSFILWRHSSRLLEISQDGVLPRRVTGTTIPWSDIERIRVSGTLFGKRIDVILKSGKRFSTYGAPGFLPFFLYGRFSFTKTIRIGQGLDTTAGRIANEINRFPYRPERLLIK